MVSLHGVQVQVVHDIRAEGLDLGIAPADDQAGALVGLPAVATALGGSDQCLRVPRRELAAAAQPQDLPQLELLDVARSAPPGTR
ncbi:MAG TPA: hypothetical protein VF004_10135 [Burkholderiales bacterium]